MKAAVRRIDRAIKHLYNLEINYKAEDYLMPTQTPGLGSAPGFQGALLVRSHPARGLEQGITLGIYLNEPLKEQLADFTKWNRKLWSHEQISAFSVAAEEISHFNYLLYHTAVGRPLSQLELELQGEIDKFLLVFFALVQQQVEPVAAFDLLFEQLFVRYRLSEHLSEDQKARYHDASQLAMKFVQRCRRYLHSPSQYERAFRLLRRFYRLNNAEKISLIATLS